MVTIRLQAGPSQPDAGSSGLRSWVLLTSPAAMISSALTAKMALTGPKVTPATSTRVFRKAPARNPAAAVAARARQRGDR